jgi:hypothetical protein
MPIAASGLVATAAIAAAVLSRDDQGRPVSDDLLKHPVSVRHSAGRTAITHGPHPR